MGYYQITNKGLVRYVFVPKALLRSAQFNFDEVFFALNLKTPVSPVHSPNYFVFFYEILRALFLFCG